DEAATGGGPVGGGLGPEHHAGGAQAVGEHGAELNVEDPADGCRLAAAAGDARDGVGGGPAGHLDARAHGLVQGLGPVGVDEGHRSLDQAVVVDEGLRLVGQDVDEGVADADDVEGGRT